MISEIRIQNFKSIEDLTLKPGRVTVLIGENGSGKSNLLEGIAFAACAAEDKLDVPFLVSRGIRVTEDTWMRSAFPNGERGEGEIKHAIPVSITVIGAESEPVFECVVNSSLRSDDGSFDGWKVTVPVHRTELEEFLKREDVSQEVQRAFEEMNTVFTKRTEKRKLLGKNNSVTLSLFAKVIQLATEKTEKLSDHASKLGLAEFVVYAPENTVLRTPPPEGAIEPLGTRGEGLFKLLQSFADPKFAERLADLKECLHLFGWFDDFLPPDDVATAQARLQIRDRWLAPERAIFDQRSANEGFLYVLFYLTLLASWRTPKFFAIDNVDTALNPKLCSTLMRTIANLAEKYDKQVICTTHNPAILDGMNLHGENQRLYTTQRDSEGRTTVRRVRPPQPQPGETPIRLSEAFPRGLLGGLPKNF